MKPSDWHKPRSATLQSDPKKWQVIMEEEEEDGDDDDGDDADESGGIELGAEERKEMIMNLREEQTGSILDHRRQRANWWGIGSRSMWPPRLFRDGAPCRRTRLVQPQRRTNKFS